MYQPFAGNHWATTGPTHSPARVVLQLQHLAISAHTIACARAQQSLSVRGFGIVNDRADIYKYFIFNVQSCGLQLEPFLDIMAPELT